MASAEYMSENVRSAPVANLGLVALAALGVLTGLVVAVVPVVEQSVWPIDFEPVNLAMTAMFGGGLLMLGLGAALRRADAFHRGAGVIGGILMIAFSVSFLVSPLAGLILLTLTTFGAFLTLAVTYLFGPVEEEEAEVEADVAEEATEPAARDDRRSAEVIRHPSWHTPIPANLPRAIELKQEVCKPHSRLIL